MYEGITAKVMPRLLGLLVQRALHHTLGCDSSMVEACRDQRASELVKTLPSIRNRPIPLTWHPHDVFAKHATMAHNSVLGVHNNITSSSQSQQRFKGDSGDKQTWMDTVSAWPMCRAPVTFGGGNTWNQTQL